MIRCHPITAVSAAAVAAAVAVVGTLAGCTSDDAARLRDLPRRSRAQALAAHCSVEVVGYGVKDVETDYVPHVVNCENGDADWEELKAQAVAARAYLYYKLSGGGTAITSGTSNQVYSCARDKLLSQKHLDAAKATAGQVLMYGGQVIWPCFNAGSKPSDPSCKPSAGGADTCITYNEGKTGTSVKPSPCGSSENPKNRGCLAQNGGQCLALLGKSYVEILQFYYGADIQLVTATGACVSPVLPPDAGSPPPADGAIQPVPKDSGSSAASDGPDVAPLPAFDIGSGTAPSDDDAGAGGRGNPAATPGAGRPVLSGGCSAAGPGDGSDPRAPAVLALLALLGCCWRARRARRPRHRA